MRCGLAIALVLVAVTPAPGLAATASADFTVSAVVPGSCALRVPISPSAPAAMSSLRGLACQPSGSPIPEPVPQVFVQPGEVSGLSRLTIEF